MLRGNKEMFKRKSGIFSRIVIVMLVAILCGCIILPTRVYAESKDNIYYMGDFAKKGEGYSDNKKMNESDVHYGWNLGKFKVSGFTRRVTDSENNDVFLKNVGDQIKLQFELEQDIDRLNNNEDLAIAEEPNGYDNYFGISKDNWTNFGRGALLIKKTDYQNKTTYIQPYTNYLSGVTKGATTDITFFEEGDYEVALDYEVVKKSFLEIAGWRPLDFDTNYQIIARFSVRNGNCMIYPFDAVTGNELTNTSFTNNGFYLDLVNSRYLNIDVKKQNLIEKGDELVEDTRFNKPASDGERFLEPGVYNIIAKNIYTNAITEKKIYVGDDPVLKAYVTTGRSVKDIKKMVEEGAVIEENGTITLSTNEMIQPESSGVMHDVPYVYIIVVIVSFVAIVLIAIVLVVKNNKKKHIKREGVDR